MLTKKPTSYFVLSNVTGSVPVFKNKNVQGVIVVSKGANHSASSVDLFDNSKAGGFYS